MVEVNFNFKLILHKCNIIFNLLTVFVRSDDSFELETSFDLGSVTHRFFFCGGVLSPFTDPTYLSGRCADVFIVPPSKSPIKVGVFGILHPTVLKYYELQYPCSALHLFIEPFL
jgi:phenylalanyl-tRNA synthetase beta chain